MKKYYYAAFIPAEEGGYSIIVPDVPGVISEAETVEDAFDMAQDALAEVLREMVEGQKEIPAPSSLDEVRAKTSAHLAALGLKAWGEVLYQLVPVPNLDMVPVKVTISLSKSVLAELDSKAKIAGQTRSGFIASAAQAFAPNVMYANLHSARAIDEMYNEMNRDMRARNEHALQRLLIDYLNSGSNEPLHVPEHLREAYNKMANTFGEK